MPIKPPNSPTFAPPFVAPPGLHPKGRASSLAPEEEARNAEMKAQKRMAQAHEQVVVSQKDAERSIEGIRDEYARQSLAQATRTEEALEKERSQGYQAVSEMRKNYQKEMHRIMRDGDRQVADLKSHYQNAVYNAQSLGEQQLGELRNSNAIASDYEKRTYDNNMDFMKSAHSQMIDQTRSEHDEQYKQLDTQARDDLAKKRENVVKQSEISGQQFQERIEGLNKQHAEVVNSLYSRVKNDLDGIREDTMQKLSAYSSRQSDPFYKLVTPGAALRENSEEYILVATIPEHEQDKVSIAVRGDQLVLSGRRQNQDRLDVEPGHSVTTAAFQSFSESFPLDAQVDAKLLSKEFVGDKLIVRLPKKTRYSGEGIKYKPYKKPDIARESRPRFPENIPVGKPVKREIAGEDEKKPAIGEHAKAGLTMD